MSVCSLTVSSRRTYRVPSRKTATSSSFFRVEMYSFSMQGYGIERMRMSLMTSVIANANSTFSWLPHLPFTSAGSSDQGYWGCEPQMKISVIKKVNVHTPIKMMRASFSLRKRGKVKMRR